MKSKERLLQLISGIDRERYQYLKQFFSRMPDSAAEEFRYEEVKKNEKIISAGGRCEAVYFVLEGEIKGVDYYKTGSVYSFMDFSKMFILGDFELFSNMENYMASIDAVQDCRLLKVPASSYLRWVRQDENALYLRLNNILTILTSERKWDREYLRMSITGD